MSGSDCQEVIVSVDQVVTNLRLSVDVPVITNVQVECNSETSANKAFKEVRKKIHLQNCNSFYSKLVLRVVF